MTRMWSTRLLALGAFALALGCRSHPLPACNTPLLPEDVITKPAPVPTVPPPAGGAKLSGDPGIQPPAAFTKLPESRTPTAIPSVSPDSSEIRPPADVGPPGATPQAATGPVIKPLLVDPPKPPAGPDGFAPAPILGLPEPEAAPVAVATPRAAVVRPLPLKAGERFGHAADYKWVAGVLDYHQKGGYWSLRYADSGDDDPWGGKVRLLADERLGNFASGDVVYLEGELLAPRSAAEGATYPPYRMTDVRLVEKGR
jgi:hypothetical protein